MNILFLGDISGSAGRNAVFKHLYDLKREREVDFCIANAENSAGGFGTTGEVLEELVRAGVDAFTMGNHTFSKRDIIRIFQENDYDIVRPFNMPENDPGRGYMICRTNSGESIGVINALGRLFTNLPVSNPFDKINEIVDKLREKTKYIVVDFHAEATSEKKAFAYFLDGKVSAVLGTHTHTQTADEMILPKGCAFITDVGMCGARDSILGADINTAIRKFTSSVGEKFVIASGETMFNAVFISIDENGKAEKIERINI